ncbi:nuclear receptor 2C2-associated protein isoform X1 [Ahaetulla prasina]|uniref:nuclear receptor 2C2-associated protein isoform X1 n=1 Tax=Ahaetulla prasina TaxID=499056 RepID=UPI0026492521|nr:nuclear receptor 2C2-associated protein isoform X1 [Ahaetulla prasina]XP_058019411.1 nuclear receptor 2C2-associated protein isoform X1 [Ahaetulla prasina]XP_058019412.1 nuclear receptor 2C2-associated protein isoform X1 [Ahaetulla prasina]XP_058019413.1 nuclear receptor 2C2-associated protein isoform X1 [Ahaetulla prasina]
MAVSSLICPETISRVSSVLNREVKQFGKKYMFDGNEETSWNSDQGAIQWMTMEFPQTVQASQIQIQFQGGFASGKCILQAELLWSTSSLRSWQQSRAAMRLRKNMGQSWRLGKARIKTLHRRQRWGQGHRGVRCGLRSLQRLTVVRQRNRRSLFLMHA